MKLLIKLGWRNIWRNKRRSLLTLIAIAFATFSAIAMRGIQLGTYDVNIRTAVEMFTGYIQIQKEGYQSNPSIRKSYRFSDEIQSVLSDREKIRSFTPRVYADGLISYKDKSLGAAIFGIDPSTEKKTTKIMEKLNSGFFFSSDTSMEIVIGRKLLHNLSAGLGDTIVILAQGYDGALGNLKFEISGTIKTGSQEMDAMGVFMGIKTAQDLLSLYGKIHAVALNVEELDNIPEVQSYLRSAVNTEELAVLNWEELMPDFKETIQFDNVSGIFFLGILFVIVTFGILNTVLMSVTERFKEFGVTLSIGMPQINLVYLVFIETIFITLLGLLVGNIIGWGINIYIYLNPIEFGGNLSEMYAEYGFLPLIESSLDLSIFINNSLMILLVAILAAIYPAYKVYKLEPLKGLRYT